MRFLPWLFIITKLAWGANDFVPTTDANDGFEADEGFDSFLAMQAPPEVIRSIIIIHTIDLAIIAYLNPSIVY